jgi:hypothetical protein
MGEHTLESNITPALISLVGIGLAVCDLQQTPEPVTSTYARLGPIDPRYSTISKCLLKKLEQSCQTLKVLKTFRVSSPGLLRRYISNIIQLKIYHAMAIARPGRVRETTV